MARRLIFTIASNAIPGRRSFAPGDNRRQLGVTKTHSSARNGRRDLIQIPERSRPVEPSGLHQICCGHRFCYRQLTFVIFAHKLVAALGQRGSNDPSPTSLWRAVAILNPSAPEQFPRLPFENHLSSPKPSCEYPQIHVLGSCSNHVASRNYAQRGEFPTIFFAGNFPLPRT